MFPRNENRNEGTFAKTALLETALLSPSDSFLVVSKRVVSADVPPERKPERGYVRQNHPFTKPPFYLPVRVLGGISIGNGPNTVSGSTVSNIGTG